ncbi:MAG: hypothetical protein NTU89_00925 [Candidatus Dependentiae bacterium]|nr:hypothetical protein [Candidatus Dependentiae bacterium]
MTKNKQFLILLVIIISLKPVRLFANSIEETQTMNASYMKGLSENYYFEQNISIDNDQSSVDFFKTIKTVVILCPYITTGGPESLCQIAQELKKEGFDVYMLWMRTGSLIHKKNINGVWYLSVSDIGTAPLVYQNDYNIFNLNKDVALDSSTLMVVPEIWCDCLTFFDGAKKMIAWLSIQNIHAIDKSRTVRKLIDKKLLYVMDCLHICNAPCVETALKDWGANPYLVQTYINLKYVEVQKEAKVENTIAYSPLKGAALGKSFISKYQNYDYISLKGLDILKMINSLDRAQIYIDFGHFPGRERVPREALLRDCVIFIHNVGCARDYDSFPI